MSGGDWVDRLHDAGRQADDEFEDAQYRPAADPLPSVLDDLERAHAAATRGEWYVARRRHMFSDSTSHPGIGETYMPADAEAIVAAVNALPGFVAAVRAVLDRHKPSMALFMTDRCDQDDEPWPCSEYRAVTAALSPESVQSDGGERR